MPGVYRRLQRHLDEQTGGFPATWNGSDLRLLRHLFSEPQAHLALLLTGEPQTTAALCARAGAAASDLLPAMRAAGSIGWQRTADGSDAWHLLPLVVGMYESQDGVPDPAFMAVAEPYVRSFAFGLSFLATRPSPLRTIPVGITLAAGAPSAAPYERIEEIVRTAALPLVVIPCICRAEERRRGHACRVTAREETCVAFGDFAATIRARGHGRELTRDAALALFRENAAEGLVLQPANAQQPGFVCSCCGCCCGMLKAHRLLPLPAASRSRRHRVAVADSCTGCGRCLSRCQVGALTVRRGRLQADARRCLGCGQCVMSCPVSALTLAAVPADPPPDDTAALAAATRQQRAGPSGKLLRLLRLLPGVSAGRDT